jgi:hypothetical protein
MAWETWQRPQEGNYVEARATEESVAASGWSNGDQAKNDVDFPAAERLCRMVRR